MFKEHVERPKEDIDQVCAIIAASRHIGILRTKYTRQMATYFAALDPRTVKRWHSKFWLCFSAENQEYFDERWADLRPFAEAGWFVFTSLSPLLDLVTLPPDFLALGKWVIVNGECEQIKPEECRPMEADWARAIRDQCRAARIPFFMRAMHSGAYVQPVPTHSAVPVGAVMQIIIPTRKSRQSATHAAIIASCTSQADDACVSQE